MANSITKSKKMGKIKFSPKLKFLDIILGLVMGVVFSIGALVLTFTLFNINKTNDEQSFSLTLTSSVIYLAVAFSFWLFIMKRNKISFEQMGFKKVPLKTILKMIPLGVGLFFVNICIIVFLSLNFKQLVPDNKTPLDSVVTAPDAFLIGFILLVMAPFIEEFVFRGIFYRYLRQRMPFLLAALISGLIFGSLHDVIPALTVVGIALALVYERYGSLYPSITVHMVNNSLVMFFFLLSHKIK